MLMAVRGIVACKGSVGPSIDKNTMLEKYNNFVGAPGLASSATRNVRRSKRASRFTKATLIGSDMMAIAASFLAPGFGTWFTDEKGGASLFPFFWGRSSLIQWSILSFFMMAAISRFWWAGHYSLRKPFWDELREVYEVFLQLALINAFLLFMRGVNTSPWLYGVTWLLIFLVVPGMRVISKKIMKGIGVWSRPTVIVGCGENAVESVLALQTEPLMDSPVIAFLALPSCRNFPQDIEVGGRSIPVLPLGRNPDNTLAMLGRPHVAIALESDETGEFQAMCKDFVRNSEGVMSVFPPMRGLPLFGMETNHFFGHGVLMIQVRNNLARRAPRLIKRMFDIVGSAVGLVILSPLFLYISFRIRQSGGDAIYRHKRVGKDGRHFDCYKFRTMVPNAGEVLEQLLENDPVSKAEWEQDRKLRNDPRITPIGGFLRKTSLDELPQLWNVLRGEMSLVGPRPIVDEELEKYGDKSSYYLEVRPGITGLWQISGRNDATYNSRVFLDAWYVQNWSLLYDIVIMVRTIKVVFGGNGAY